MKKKGLEKEKSGEHNLETLLNKYSLFVLCSLLTGILFIVFHEYIFFEKLYLFKGLASDSLNDTYPNYILISDYLRSDGIPKWSFRQGIGQGIFPFSFPDPFVSLLYLLGREYLAYGIAYMELVKIFLAGIIFYLFLKKRSLSVYVSVMGGLMYSFSSFMIIGSCWNLFSTEVVYLAFLLLAFEEFYQDHNWSLFPVAIALIAILQPFDLWLFGIFLFVYILVRHYEEHQSTGKLISFLFRIGILTLFGIAIGSFFFLSEIRLMLNSPRIGGASGYFGQLLSQFPNLDSEIHYVTAIMRFFSSELLGPSNNYGGWYNFMEAPLFYCGLINLLLAPQFFQFLDYQNKRYYGTWFAFMISPVIIPFLRYSFWLFTGNYYRVYSFFVAIMFLFFSIQALHYILKYNRINRKLLLITLAVLLIVLYYPYNFLQHSDVLNDHLRNVITLFLFIYSGVLFFLPYSKNPLQLRLILLVVVCFELVIFSKMNVNERRALTAKEYTAKRGYSDYTGDAINYLKTIDKGFFRVSKNYTSGPTIDPSFNDSKIQGFRGTGSYHSFNQLYYVKFLAGMNIIDEKKEDQTRWIIGLRNLPYLHSYIGVKYFLYKGGKPVISSIYDSLTTIGDVKIYRNKFSLPLSFTYTHHIPRREFNLLTPGQKEVTIYHAFILNDSIYPQYMKILPPYINSGYKIHSYQYFMEGVEKLKKDTLALSKFSNNNIKGTITLKERKMLFFSIPYSEGWSAKVDGMEQSPVRINIGFIGLLLQKGTHQIELTYTPPMFLPGAVISLVAICLYLFLILFKHGKIFKRSGRRIF